MDNLQAYGNIGLAISKINMAITKLNEACKHENIEVDCNFYAKELVNVVNNLFILQDKLKDKV